MRTKAKVYFADFHMPYGGDPLPVKLRKLMKKAGFEELDLKDKFVAIKMHFGEKGNLAFLRPNYAKAVADYVKERGGKPFLTDCNTLYVGSRKNALEHLDTAYENGFNPLCTGCQTIIADGLKGTDEELLPVPNGEFVREAKVGKALADADVVLSLTHFKGHEMAGFGGAIKNVGMGGGSRAGKMEQHSDGKVQVDQVKCVGCGRCVNICAHGAPSLTDRKSSIDPGKCVGCGRCLALCPTDAIAPHRMAGRQRLQQEDGRIRRRHCPWQAPVPHQPDCRCVAELRLPCRKRRAHRAGHRHALLHGHGCPGPGLRRFGQRGGTPAERPAGQEHRQGSGRSEGPGLFPLDDARIGLEDLPGPCGKDWPGHAGI